MDYNTQTSSEFECGLCDGSGVYIIGNGREDFDREFCKCPAGERAQQEADDEWERQAAEANRPHIFDLA